MARIARQIDTERIATEPNDAGIARNRRVEPRECAIGLAEWSLESLLIGFIVRPATRMQHPEFQRND